MSDTTTGWIEVYAMLPEKDSIEADFDKFFADLFCTSWSRVNTGCLGFDIFVAPIELNLAYHINPLTRNY